MTLPFEAPKLKIAEFANSVDLNEAAHNEPPHLDLHCLHSGPWILNIIWHGRNSFQSFQMKIFFLCLFWRFQA